jgi:hypothetical protein
MGFKQAAVLSSISFFLGELRPPWINRFADGDGQGVLFICFNVDHRILYGELTEEAITDGFTFYTTFFNAPPAIKVREVVCGSEAYECWLDRRCYTRWAASGLQGC